jgi:hypothetical protein
MGAVENLVDNLDRANPSVHRRPHQINCRKLIGFQAGDLPEIIGRGQRRDRRYRAIIRLVIHRKVEGESGRVSQLHQADEAMPTGRKIREPFILKDRDLTEVCRNPKLQGVQVVKVHPEGGVVSFRGI